MIMRLFIVIIYLLALVSVTLGCQTSHVDGEGPLWVKGIGGFALYSYDLGEPPWYYTSGYYPCVNFPGTQNIEIVNVTYQVNEKAPPLEVHILKREVIDGDEDRWSAPEFELSGAPHQVDPQHGIPLKGEITEEIQGMKVIRRCGEVDMNSHSSILVVSKSDRKGSQIESITIDYLADGKPYTVVVPWEMTICGEAIDDPEICPKDKIGK